jgi:hypothetical protein
MSEFHYYLMGISSVVFVQCQLGIFSVIIVQYQLSAIFSVVTVQYVVRNPPCRKCSVSRVRDHQCSNSLVSLIRDLHCCVLTSFRIHSFQPPFHSVILATHSSA